MTNREDNKTSRIQVLLPQSLMDELTELSEQESRSLSHLGREAIRQYLFLNQARKR